MNLESLSVWETLLKLPESTPHAVAVVFVLVALYCLVIFPCSLVMSFIERKLSADLQARIGPNRVGPGGFFQPIIDIFKLLQKRDDPQKSRTDSFWLVLSTMALYSTVAVLPFGSLALLMDTDMSAFLPFWAIIVFTFCTMMMGLAQNSVSGWLGGLRIALQAISGIFPALITLLCAGIPAGGFRWGQIAAAQGAIPFHWTALSSPFGFIAFVVFLISGMVLLAVAPLDGALSVSDIHGGVSAHLSGKNLSRFRLTRFYGLFLWCAVTAVLFLGGWLLPEFLVGFLRESDSLRILLFAEVLVLLIKTFILMLLIVTFNQVTPRVRVDQTTDLVWRVLSPFALTALVGMAFWSTWVSSK